MTAVAVARPSGPTVAAPRPLRVAWIGEPPAWITAAAAAGELEGVELCTETDAEVLHLGGRAARRRVQRDHHRAAIVLDLSAEPEPRLGPLMRPPARTADRIVVGSLAALRLLRARHPALAARITLVRPPVDLDANAPLAVLARSRGPVAARFRRLHRLTPSTILYAGPYTEEGGLDVVLGMAERLRERVPELCVAAVPTGDVDRRYLDRCERRALGLGHRGVVAWQVPDDERPLWYAHATVVCAPSRAAVWSPAALFAAAAARPFVGSHLEPFADEVVEAETGHLTPPGDEALFEAAVEGLLGDTEQAARLGERARQVAEAEIAPSVAAGRLRQVWSDAFEAFRRRVGS